MSVWTTHTRSAPVAIVGAGPVGLGLALSLARQGIRSVLVERNETTGGYSKAPGIHVRTREVLRQWGIEERFLEAGALQERVTRYSAGRRRPLIVLDHAILADEADRPGILILEQAQTERLLLDAVRETGLCDISFGAEAESLEQDGAGVRLGVRMQGSEHTIEAEFLVGCDGARSFVRTALGLPFEGATYPSRPMLADVEVADERDLLDWPRTRNDRSGLTTGIRLRPGVWRLIHLEPRGGSGDRPVAEGEVQDRVEAVLGPGPFRLIWASRFRIHLRASPRFRVGRVMLAGDAAHVHSPAGGLGMNGGIQDAHNLGWKLAAALRGGDVDGLLDSYDVERRAVMVESISRYSDLLTRYFLQAPAIAREAAFLAIRAAFVVPSVRRLWLRRMTMIDVRYPESPLLLAGGVTGMRLPNAMLADAGGNPVRLYHLLGYGSAIIQVDRDTVALEGIPVDRVIRVGAGGLGDPTRTLRRLLGGTGGWILVRPDAHVGWASDRPDGMEEAVRAALGILRRTNGVAEPTLVGRGTSRPGVPTSTI